MGLALLPGNPPIEITLRRSRQARRLSLRVSRIDGRVTLSLPPWTPEAEALAFARDREAWLRRALVDCARDGGEAPRPGSMVPVEGRSLVVGSTTGRGVRVEGDGLFVPGDPAQVAPRIAAFLKLLARDRLAAASDRHAARLGTPYSTLTLRDTRSRWGSCAPDGRLMYSWRLVMAPPAVLDYVAAHEVAHLVEMNHAPAFWRVVGRLCPGYRMHRDWLKRNGPGLHRWRFDVAG